MPIETYVTMLSVTGVFVCFAATLAWGWWYEQPARAKFPTAQVPQGKTGRRTV
jgi:hypothetical protein